ncbi:MAG: hypothetical protein ACK5NF_02305 [Bacilli bacterium]
MIDTKNTIFEITKKIEFKSIEIEELKSKIKLKKEEKKKYTKEQTALNLIKKNVESYFEVYQKNKEILEMVTGQIHIVNKEVEKLEGEILVQNKTLEKFKLELSKLEKAKKSLINITEI